MAYETAEDIRKRVELLKREVIFYGSKYGWTDDSGRFYPYSVNINNEVMRPVYDCYKQLNSIHGAPSDKQRIEWECGVKKLLARHFLETYHYKLDLKNVGLQVQRYRMECLEEMVAGMNPQKIIEELYGRKQSK